MPGWDATTGEIELWDSNFSGVPSESGTFSEAFSVGDANNYTAALGCTGNTTALAGGVLSINPADTAIVCTHTNVRKSASLSLRKTWVNASVGNAVTLPATTGFTINTASFASTANSANDTGIAVTVYAGDSGTVRAEAFTSGTPGSYRIGLGVQRRDVERNQCACRRHAYSQWHRRGHDDRLHVSNTRFPR